MLFTTVEVRGSVLLALALFVFSAQAATTFTIDCGSATDSNFTGGASFTAVPLTPPGTTDMTIRFGSAFNYTFPADNIPYIVTFQFMEPCGSTCSAGPVTGAAQRLFTVTVNDEPVLPNLDIFTLAGGSLIPINRSVMVMGSDQTIRVVFTSQIRTAVVSSIIIQSLYDSILNLSSQTAWSILNSKCTRCHGNTGPPPDTLLTFAAIRQEVGGLDLRTRESILLGGSRGPAMILKNGAASLIYRFTTFVPSMPPSLADLAKLFSADARGLLRMPPYGNPALSTVETAALKLWIDLGAP